MPVLRRRTTGILACVGLISICSIVCAPVSAAPALMPLPAKMSLGSGKLTIDSSFSARISGYSNRTLEAAVARFTTKISQQTGIPLIGAEKPSLVIECRKGGAEYPSVDDDESYQLEVTAAGAHLSAPSVAGALRGMETLSQLVASDADSFYLPALKIEDQPRFPWRGLMLDVARHWMPVPVIERNLDAMAAVKLNVFHWHLSDDQGFRVESKVFPKLHQLGSDGHFYTQAEVRRVVAYARDRGIRVVPEFDVPGHTTSWLVGYPELASAPGPFKIERKWGIFEPTMDPTRDEVYTFLDGFIGEMASLFPDEYFHIGGDEVRDAQWLHNPAIQAFCKTNGLKNSKELHAYFNQRLQAIVRKHGKKMIGWDEVLSPGLAADTVIQSWQGQQSLADAARKGYRGILSYGYYLDHMDSSAFHYHVDPLSREADQLSRAETTNILGGEACMWSEYVTEETVDSRVWPRAAVVAERLWSPAGTTDVESMYARLEVTNHWLDWSGIKHRSEFQRMLERLAGGHSAPALRVLAEAVEALGIGVRQETRQYRSDIPLNRLVDAARPESESVRRVSAILARAMAQPGEHRIEIEELRRIFTEWQANSIELRPLMANSFLLREVAPLSEDLSRAGTIGLTALQYLESGQRAPAQWVAEQTAELTRMGEPRAEVVLAAARPVKALVESFSKGSVATGGER
jgi:hexosaminidase